MRVLTQTRVAPSLLSGLGGTQCYARAKLIKRNSISSGIFLALEKIPIAKIEQVVLN